MKNELKVGRYKTSCSHKFKSVILVTVFSLILSFCFIMPTFSANEIGAKPAINQGVGLNDETNAALQQSKTITGTVVDEDGVSLPGVSVVVKGTTTGTVTDIDGKYSLNVSPGAKTLVFSFIGMSQQEIPIGSQSQINVTLEQGIVNLDEVVAIGYGSMEKNNVTGAISSIKADEIMKAPVPNVVEALRGQVSGVKISRASGQPGSKVDFLIRGKKSLSSSNEPLIVIDGVPNTGGNLAEINPADIATINILKDAAAASIYGASAANGVVLITTKNGVFGKPSLNVEFSYGLSDLAMEPVMFNAREYVEVKNAASIGGGLGPKTPEQLLDAVELKNWGGGDSIKESNWHDVLLKIGHIKNASVSLSGGTDKFHYYMNGDAYLEDGIAQHSTYDRYSMRVNADYAPYDFLTVGARMQLSKSIADETGSTLYNGSADFGDFVGNSPLGRLYDDYGRLVPTVKGDQFQYNPLYRYRESQVDRNSSRVYINPWFEIKIFDGLTYRMNAFAEQRFENYKEFYSSIYNNSELDADPGTNKLRIQLKEEMTYLWDNILNYHKIFNEVHSVDATFVYGIQTYDTYTLNTNGQGSSSDVLKYNDMSSVPASNSTVTYDPDEWGKEYYVARVGYGYDERYSITATFRRDGSSKFGPLSKYGNFPSIAAAWNIQNESFMKSVDPVSILKYRVSYGLMGNDNIPTYRYLATTSNGTAVFNQTGYTGKTTDPQVFPNANLRWEKSNQFNTGIDFGLFKNRISGTIDYYNTLTTDLLLTEQIPSTTGYTQVMSNVGKTKNWGIDANIDFAILTGEFKWDMSVNWAKDHNEIVSLSRYAVDKDGKPVDDKANGWFIGQDIDVIYDYKFIGIYSTSEEDIAMAKAMNPTIKTYGPGDAKIADVAGKVTDENPTGGPDGIIDTNDKTFLGSPTPSWYGGIRNTLSYKGFELTVLFEAVMGVEKINGYYGNLTMRDNQIKVDYWTPEDQVADFPQPNVKKEYDFADAVKLRDASFISLRNLSFGYNVPSKLIKKTPFKALAVFVRGNNLKYFTDYKDSYSPEIDPWNFPITKTWTFSAKITF
jgi:TonB-dependent starch-binding outer membrane protein SusC